MIQMAWLSLSPDSAKILHIRLSSSDPWQPYTRFPVLCRPDDRGNSKGYATMQALLKRGAVFVPNAEIEEGREAA